MEDNKRIWWIVAAAVALVIIALFIWWPRSAGAAQLQEECTSESTGLKYVEIEGSGLASMFFFPFLLAMAPVAGATDVNGQYRCHVHVIGSDAVGAKKKIRNRPKVEPY